MNIRKQSWGLLCCTLFSLSLNASTEIHETLSISITPVRPKSISSLYKDEFETLQSTLGTTSNTHGYRWGLSRILDRDLHISLLNFKKGSYGENHVTELKDILLRHTDIAGIQGNFYRPELWLKKTNTQGSAAYAHFVHASDQTRKEKKADNKSFDQALRTTASITSHEQFDSGHIVLRYGTQGKLAEKISALGEDLSKTSKTSTIAKSLSSSVIDYNTHLIAHLSIARIIRHKNGNKAQQQAIAGTDLMDLIATFETFRNALAKKNNSSEKSLSWPFNAEQITLSSGLREKRKVLHTLDKESKPTEQSTDNKANVPKKRKSLSAIIQWFRNQR
ncbi:MAG: hypothetical protein ACTHJ4_07955 [Candidatus Nucleicultricaceae bacterium]